MSATAQWQGMQQVRGPAKVDTSEQRKIIRSLQKPKMIENYGFAGLLRRESRIGANLLPQ
jgi:hypothetical protein